MVDLPEVLQLNYQIANMQNKKEYGRGGTRKGSGAKPKYNEETKTVAFRCPTSKVDEIKMIIKSKLSEWTATRF